MSNPETYTNTEKTSMQIDLVTRSSSTMRELLLFVGISILRPSLGVEPDPYSVDVISAFNQTICPLEPIENGHYLDISDTKGGIAVQVVCSLGYKRVGNGFHMCNVTTGNFSNGRSYCQGCPLEHLENGHYLDVSDDKVGVAIQVVCSSGYKLEGIGYHVCDVTTGNFTNGRSYCQDIDECQGNVTRHQCNINAACINLPGNHLCKCKLGYAGNGINCRRVEDCSPLPNPENGRVILTNRVARYECYPGFHRYGPGIRLCRRGKWNRVAPKCVEAGPNSCRTPRAPLHGTVAGANFEKGQMIRYFCDKGYVLEGPETRNCSESLRWTGIRPVCVQEASRSVTEIAETLKDKISDISAGSSTGRLHTGGASGADIVFMIDRSSSIKPSNLNRVKDFMMMVIAELGVDNANPEGNGTRIAVLTFGNKPEMLFNLDNKTINSEVKVRQMLDSIKPYGGETALRDAIEKVYTESAQIARPKAQKALFIFADGQSTVKTTSDTKFFLRMLKDKNSGFEVFVIGVGARIMVKDLLQYASKPSRKYFFNLENFEDLTRLTHRVVLDKNNPSCGTAGRVESTETGTNTEAKPGSWPWMALVYDDNDGEGLNMCGGTLICRNWVLTLARCVQGNQITVELGVHDLFDENVARRLHPIKVHRFDNDLGYDLALLEFDHSATQDMLGPRINPICLTANPGGGSEWLGKRNVWIAGRGAQPPRLNGKIRMPLTIPVYTKLPIVSKVDCTEAFKGRQLSGTDFCAGHKYIQEYACRGDIGGPLMYKDGDRYRLLGVAKETEHCVEEKMYGLFTEVLSLEVNTWINTITDNCNLSLQDNILK